MKIKNIFSRLKEYRENEDDITMEELNQIIRTNANSILLDVRSPQEYKEGFLNRCNKYTTI